ncbi:mucin-related [Striga hermonthica]|uniref:Mucin-related n=1 Tax=Striga hermonthica TaxID=68872 RepID=A0A9N7N9N4_STRHE|nr:mucin-related [Striga hermonthica]
MRTPIRRLSSTLKTLHPNPTSTAAAIAICSFSTNRTTGKGRTREDEWNDAWKTAWLPNDLTGKSQRAPWASNMDPETQAFVEDMNDNWDQRKGKSVKKDTDRDAGNPGPGSGSSSSSSSLYNLENIKSDYRLTKQKIHAGLWVKEIERMEEAKLGDSVHGDDDIEKLLDSASEIFDSANNDFGDPENAGSELKNKPDGWETTSKAQDGNVWDMSQREEDILVQEFERRIAFNKFKIASFIKTHIFSRRRPIDGWKYMIEEIGSNARKEEALPVLSLPQNASHRPPSPQSLVSSTPFDPPVQARRYSADEKAWKKLKIEEMEAFVRHSEVKTKQAKLLLQSIKSNYY